MLKLIFVIFLFSCCSLFRCIAQTPEKLRTALQEQGFENVRVMQQDSSWIITLENNMYRWDVTALATAMGLISGQLPEPARVKLILLDKDVPELLVAFRGDDWLKFRSGMLPANAMQESLQVTEVTDPEWEIIRHEKPAHRNTGKTDLVLYPQFAFENTLKDRLYTSQLNIAPALEVTLWRGMQFTGQVIFPLYNQLGYEGDFIRPGQVILSQEFKYRRLTGKAALGNFNAHRVGGDISLRYILPGENWSLKGNAGLTGSSHFLDNRWQHSPLNTFTWSVSAAWFIPRFHIETEGGIRRYIYGDTGIFGSCTRWFGETAFGFYAMAGKESFNGGFHFSVPFPDKKRDRKHFFRVTIPDHQDMIYNAGTEFHYGQTYRVGPGSNLVRGFYRAGYMKREILGGRTLNDNSL